MIIGNSKEVRNAFKKWKQEAGMRHVIMYKYDENTKIMTIYTSNPGFLIGRAGSLAEKYTLILKSIMCQELKSIRFEEVKNFC